MESLIPVIGKLQDVFSTIGFRETEIQLPQIVVIGSQVPVYFFLCFKFYFFRAQEKVLLLKELLEETFCLVE